MPSDPGPAQENVRPRVERVFIVRLWREEGTSPHRAFRGSVLDVASTRRLFFASLDDLTDFLDLRLDDPQGA